MSAAADVLRAYGSAIRGDWSEIDGRDVLSSLCDIADAVEREANGEAIDRDALGDALGVCVHCGCWQGSYYGYCKHESNADASTPTPESAQINETEGGYV